MSLLSQRWPTSFDSKEEVKTVSLAESLFADQVGKVGALNKCWLDAEAAELGHHVAVDSIWCNLLCCHCYTIYATHHLPKPTKRR